MLKEELLKAIRSLVAKRLQPATANGDIEQAKLNEVCDFMKQNRYI